MPTVRNKDDWANWEDSIEDQASFQKLTRHSSARARMPARSRTAAYRAVRRATRKRSASQRERFAGAHMRRHRKPLYEKPGGDNVV
jgi:hypothetical protein